MPKIVVVDVVVGKLNVVVDFWWTKFGGGGCGRYFKQLLDTNLPEVPFSLSNAYTLLLDDLLEVLTSDEQDRLIRLRIEQYRHI